MRFAITGAGGFLGTEILRQLSQFPDIKVYAFVFESELQKNTFVRAGNIIPVDNGKVSDFDFSDIDVLLNCAFPRNVDDASFAGGLDFIQQVLLKAATDHVKSVVNISSQSVYSQKRLEPADESSLIILESKYAVGKYGIELLINSLFMDVPHTNLRMASLIGAGFNQRLTNRFAAKIVAGEQIVISGGDQIFGFMDVRDAAEGIIAVMCNRRDNWLEKYNFGTNKSYTLLEIAELTYSIGIKMGYKAPKVIQKNEGVWQNSSMLCDRFFKQFEWLPKWNLENTLMWIYQNL